MDSLIKRAKELLENKTVNLIVGYGNGTAGKVRAIFVKNTNEAEKLIFDNRCTQNLAVYLTKEEVKHAGKIAIVAPVSVMRTINMLISEQQVFENNVLILGIDADGKLLDFPSVQTMENYLQKVENFDIPEKDRLILEKLKTMTIAERFEYWQETMETCFKCYACRSACPLCYCTRCAVECNQPQWIPVAPHAYGNIEWHMLRAMHLAGRCISCGECGRACPLDLPVHLFTMQMAIEAENMYGIKSGLSSKQESVFSTYKLNDKENFIK